MKYCEEFAALLDPYVDGELPLEEAARVRAHLAVCGGCRAYVQAALAIRDAFPDAEDTEMPEGFAETNFSAEVQCPHGSSLYRMPVFPHLCLPVQQLFPQPRRSPCKDPPCGMQ